MILVKRGRFNLLSGMYYAYSKEREIRATVGNKRYFFMYNFEAGSSLKIKKVEIGRKSR